MAKIFDFSLRPYYGSLITIVVLVIVLTGYFLVYVPNNAELINHRNFRALQRIENNLNKRAENNIKLAHSFSKELVNSKGLNKIDNSFKKNAGDPIFLHRDLLKYRSITIDHNAIEKEDSLFFKTNNNQLSFIVHDKVDSNISNIDNLNYRFEASCTIKQFVRTFMQTDYFDNIVLFKNDTVIDALNNINIYALFTDSGLNKRSGYLKSGITDVLIDGAPYKCFAIPMNIRGNDLVLWGLSETNNYNSSKFSLPYNFLIFISLFLVLLFLSFPIIKIITLNKFESLDISDVINGFICFSLMIFFATLMLIDFYYYFNQDSDSRQDKLKNLAEKLDTNFTKELEKVVSQIELSDSLIDFIQRDFVLNNDSFILDTTRYLSSKPFTTFATGDSNLAYSYPLFNSKYADFKLTFWLDSEGMELYSISNKDGNSPRANYSDREYFKKLQKGIRYNLGTDSNSDFILQPIYSYTTGTFRTAISKNSNAKFPYNDNGTIRKPKVVVMSTDLHSVVETILPEALHYAIIDEAGLIWYSSEKRKNLNENFFESCEPNEDLKAHINAQRDDCMNIVYEGNNCNALVRPIKGMPLHIVTYYERSVFGYPNVFVFEFAFTGIFLLLIVNLICVLIVALSSRKETLLVKPFFSLNWLWPQNKLSKNYLIVIYSNLLVLFYLSLAYFFLPDYLMILLLCITAFFTITYFYFMTSAEVKASVTQSSLQALLRQAFLIFKDFAIQKRLIVFFIILIVVLINCLAIKYECFIVVFSYCFFLVAITFISSMFLIDSIYTFKAPLLNAIHLYMDRKSSKIAYHKLFSILLCSWIVLSAIIPAIIFFKAGYNREREIMIKDAQLNIVNNIEYFRNNLKTNNRYQQLSNSNSAQALNYYGDCFFDTEVKFANQDANAGNNNLPDALSRESQAQKLFRNLVANIRFTTNEKDLANNLLYLPDGLKSNSKWTINNDSKFDVNLSYTPNIYNEAKDSFIYQVSSKSKFFVFPFWSSDNWLAPSVFWIVLFLMIIASLWLIVKFIKSVFAVNYAVGNQLIYYNQNVFNSTGNNLHNKIAENRNLFLCKLPSALLTAEYVVEENIKEGVKNFQCTLLDNHPELKESEEPLKALLANGFENIYLHRFEFGFQDEKIQKLKLKLIECLLEHNKRIVIISAIEPQLYCEMGDGQMNERFSQALRSFACVFFPLQGVDIVKIDSESIKSLDTFIEMECNNDYFLKSLIPNLKNYVTLNKLKFSETNKELVILKIQHWASLHYHSLWTNLTDDERFIVFDIAFDGLVNTRSDKAIYSLLYKGILIYDEKLKLMNQSFANFVLTDIKPEETQKMKQISSSSGQWAKLKVPLILIISFVLLFLFLTQQESYNKIIAIIGAFVTIMATASRIVSISPTVPPSTLNPKVL